MAPSSTSSTPARRSRVESKAETRRLLLDAAESVFHDRGYHGASLAHVAAQAGFTKGAVYSTFDSKADLFLAVLDRRAIARQARLQAALEETTSAEELRAATAAALSRFGDSVAGERSFWAALIEFMVVIGKDEELQARFAVHHDASREAVARSVQEWADRGGATLTVEPRALATAVMALNFGLTLEGLVAPAEVEAQSYVDAQLALLQGALKLDPEKRG
jgi:AcrR family transcriptional regulator